jgi:hypothetical protein
MAIAHAQVTVGTAATLLSAGVAGRDGQTVLIQSPSGGSPIYLGSETVTSTVYGYELVAGTDFSIGLQDTEALYAVTASSTQAVYVLRQGV